MNNRIPQLALGIASFSLILTSCASSTDGLSPETKLDPVGISATTPSSSTAENAVEVDGDWVWFDTPNKLSASSDAIVIGSIGSSKESLSYPDITSKSSDPNINPYYGRKLTREDVERGAFPVTISTLTITKVIKGSLRLGTEISVRQLGGVKDDARWVEENTTLLNKIDAKEVILFLSYSNPISYDFEGKKYTVTGENTYDVTQPVTGLWVKDGQTVSLPRKDLASKFQVSKEPESAFANIQTVDALISATQLKG